MVIHVFTFQLILEHLTQKCIPEMQLHNGDVIVFESLTNTSQQALSRRNVIAALEYVSGSIALPLSIESHPVLRYLSLLTDMQAQGFNAFSLCLA